MSGGQWGDVTLRCRMSDGRSPQACTERLPSTQFPFEESSKSKAKARTETWSTAFEAPTEASAGASVSHLSLGESRKRRGRSRFCESAPSLDDKWTSPRKLGQHEAKHAPWAAARGPGACSLLELAKPAQHLCRKLLEALLPSLSLKLFPRYQCCICVRRTPRTWE